MEVKAKNFKKASRKKRVRSKISGTVARPRLAVFFSNSHLVAQAIDDVKGETIVHVTDKMIGKEGNTIEIATAVGKKMAEELVKKNTKEVVFDKGSKKYHGKVSALADAVREGGLKF